MKALWRIYGSLCGLIVAPAVGAVLLLMIMGMLPAERMREAYAVLMLPSSPAPKSGPVDEVAEVPQDNAKPPEDLRTWERRLNRMGESIVMNVEDLGREVARLEDQEERFNAVRDALAPLVSMVLEEQVSPLDIVARNQELIAKIQKLQSQETKRPKLLETLRTVDAKSIAAIFSGRGDDAGLSEREAVSLLSEFPARKAGEVLAAMGKTDPARAARLVSKMGTGDTQ